MRILQRNSQNVWLSMFQKTDEKRKNQDRDEDKIHVSRDKNERNFNYDDFFARLNFKRHHDLNKKEHETKNEQIVERASLQRIRNALSRTKKQHKLIREKKALWRFFKRRNIDEKLKQFLRLDGVEWIRFKNEHYVFTRERFMTDTFQKLRILQYNVHKLKSKMMIILLHEKRIKNYDILMIQKSWRHHEKTRMYNSRGTDFILKNNDEKTCFYINNRIDGNSWHSTWHFKDVNIITLQLRRQNEENAQNSMNTQSNSMNVSCSMNIHDVYNPSSANHNEILKKESFFALKQALRMQNESVIVNDFNLHYFVWKEFLYSKQYLLSNNLLIMMRIINVTLSLSRNIVTKNYQNFKIIINLSFATTKIADKFISCDVIHEVKNSFNHLFIDTIFDLKAQKKSKRRFKRNWKALNEKKFKNVIWKHLSKFLLNTLTNRQQIDNYTTTFL